MINNINLYGIILGVISLFIIGIWHPIVIKGEYYLGSKKCAIIFAITAIIFIILSLFISNIISSATLALFGFCSLWGIKEVYEQEERVKKGWFPKNNKKEK